VYRGNAGSFWVMMGCKIFASRKMTAFTLAILPLLFPHQGGHASFLIDEKVTDLSKKIYFWVWLNFQKQT
jgi:hypothetical protein